MIIRDYKKLEPLLTALEKLDDPKSTQADYNNMENEAAKLGVDKVDMIYISGRVKLPTGEAADLVDESFSYCGKISEIKDYLNDYEGQFECMGNCWVEDGTLYGYAEYDGEYIEYADSLEETEWYETTVRAKNAEHFHDQYVWKSTESEINKAIEDSFYDSDD
ncbi:hypothetical protein ACLUYL_07885 [Limosilactobacillus reuteri subsp. suis]|uniref:hypothetical protein n=1 Tax=Limosilactobacillus reuteri TaxID=1598 RepID=UPI0039928794